MLLVWSVPRGDRVSDYRFYRLDGAGKIATADWIKAESDDHAVEQARERASGGHFELWIRNRLITRSPGEPG